MFALSNCCQPTFHQRNQHSASFVIITRPQLMRHLHLHACWNEVLKTASSGDMFVFKRFTCSYNTFFCLLTSTSASHTFRICGSNHPGVVQNKDGVKGKISEIYLSSVCHLNLLSLSYFLFIAVMLYETFAPGCLLPWDSLELTLCVSQIVMLLSV